MARVCNKGVRETLGTYATRKEAEQALNVYNAKSTLGLAPPPGSLNVTIGEVWTAWSARALADAGASKRGNYEKPWRRSVSQYASRKIRDMGPDDWQEIIDQEARSGLAPATIGKTSALIGVLCNYAMERDYIAKDYSQYLVLPKGKAVVEKGALTHEQLTAIVARARDGDAVAEIATVLCYTGFRVDELISLQKDALDMEAWTLQGGSKTDAGRDRIVPVHPQVRGIVQKHFQRNGAQLFRIGDRALLTDTYRNRFGKLMADIGAPKATPHWCRYTFASLCHEAGVDELTQKWLMGHSTDADITHHYTKSTLQQLRDAVAKLWYPEA